jgi:hypothetical protein
VSDRYYPMIYERAYLLQVISPNYKYIYFLLCGGVTKQLYSTGELCSLFRVPGSVNTLQMVVL